MQINIKKKHIFGFSILSLLLAVILVYATAPNPGHSWSEIGDFPPACGTGEVVKGLGNGVILDCVTDQTGGEGGGTISWGSCEEINLPPSASIIPCDSGEFLVGMNMHGAGAGVYYPTKMKCCEMSIS